MVQAAAYDGGGGLENVGILDVAALTPERFWQEHIAARKPALIRGHPTDMAWRASSLWTDDYLIRRAGGAEVLVEVRGGPQEGYGKGVKRRMPFGEFVGQVAAGETGLYLTAQQVAEAPDGHPQLLAEPLLSLAGAGAGGKADRKARPADPSDAGGRADAAPAPPSADFPASLELAGHLVPQSLNLWMGAAPEGSSSGLHHDFHDNIYVLLRGTKRFRLYPPATAPAMYTHGKLARLYENGRIVYEGQGDVLADGTDAADVARWRRRTGAEAAVAEAEAAVARGEPGARARLDRCEAALEAALEAELSDALMDGEGDGDDEGDWGGEDDFDMEEEDEDGGSSSDEDEMDGDGGGKGGGRGEGKAKGKAAKAKGATENGDGEGDGGLIVDTDTPPSFSRVPLGDPRVSEAQLSAQFPRFPGRAAAVEVTVRAGEMLYLPAGWFHEVTSYGSSGSGPGGGHLAFNYWFHPPDNLDPSRRGFRAPYSSDFWPALWRARVAEGLPGGMEPGMGAQQPSAKAGANGDGDGDGGEVLAADGGGGGDAAGREKRKSGVPAGSLSGRGGDEEDAGDDGGRPRQRARRSSAVSFAGDASAEDGLQPQQQQQQKAKSKEMGHPSEGQQQQQEGGPQDGNDADLDPPRRQRPAAAVRALMAKLAAAANGGCGDGGGEAAAELTEEEYQLLMLIEAARRRQVAVGAMRAFFEKQMKLRRLRQMRASLPPGRRHHPVVEVGPQARRWRPKEQQQQQEEGGQKGKEPRGLQRQQQGKKGKKYR